MNNLDEKDLLARELRERAGDVAGHPVSFTAVRASAKRLQRRRQVVTGAVAAAVAGIALPTGVAVTAALNDNGTDTAASPGRRPPRARPTPRVPPPLRRAAVPFTIEGPPRPADTVRYIIDRQMLMTPTARWTSGWTTAR
jgi:hypothetical protein